MISSDGGAPGVAPGALLHASGYATTSATQRDAAFTANHIATRNGDEIHAINMSFGMPLDGGEGLDASAHLTHFVDWSAKRHDTLYVIAGREEGGGAGPVPSTNYNGITVAASARQVGGGGYESVWSENDYNEDALSFERVSVDLIAPGVLLDVVDVGGGLANPDVSGTSFAAPHVTGAVALLQEYAVAQIGNSSPGWSEPEARRHEVMKAILLNSAEKIGGVHGASRTHFNHQGKRWDQTTAHDNPNIPLDLGYGAGHLNVSSAVTNFSSGEHNANGASVPLIGWDFGFVGGNTLEYELDGPVAEGDWVAITMAWDRDVALTDPDNTYNSGDGFINNPISMELANLDMWLMPVGSSDTSQAIFSSTASEDSVEHIFKEVPPGKGGNYKIRVKNAGGGLGFADFGIAWWVGGGTTPPLEGDFDGDGTVGNGDLSLILDNWGDPVPPNPAGWVNDDPTAPNVGNDDMTRLLDNWGSSGFSAAVVPEPNSSLLLVLAVPFAYSSSRR